LKLSFLPVSTLHWPNVPFWVSIFAERGPGPSWATALLTNECRPPQQLPAASVVRCAWRSLAKKYDMESQQPKSSICMLCETTHPAEQFRRRADGHATVTMNRNNACRDVLRRSRSSCLLYAVRAPSNPAQPQNYTSSCNASVFQQHYPNRKRPPWTPQCAQVPHDISGDNAYSPHGD
jgi:hypothetical protein